MTSSATPLASAGFRDLRARLTFATRDDPEPPKGGTSRLRPHAPIVLGGLAAGLALLVAGAAMTRQDGPAAPVAPAAPVVPVLAAPPPPAWVEVIRPFTAFDLAGGPYAKLPMTYAARRDIGGTARQDTLTYGTAQPGTPFLRLMFYRRGAEPAPTTTGFVDAARLAAGAGLAITRSGLGSTLPTRFGTVEVAGVAVSRADRSATCLAFRLADPGTAAVLELTGLACGTDERPADLATLACTIEKLDLVSAGDDEDLRAVFVAAERRRGAGCRDGRAELRPGLPDDGRPMRSALRGPV